MQLRAKLDSAPFQLVAGHPVLDFVNTLDWRFRSSGSEELLNHYADLLRFSEQSGLMTPSEVRKLATGDLVRKRRILSSTKKLRECLASILYVMAAGQVPQNEDIKTLSAFARTVRETDDLERTGHAVPKTGVGCSGPADFRGGQQAGRLFKSGMSMVIPGRKQEQGATVV